MSSCSGDISVASRTTYCGTLRSLHEIHGRCRLNLLRRCKVCQSMASFPVVEVERLVRRGTGPPLGLGLRLQLQRGPSYRISKAINSTGLLLKMISGPRGSKGRRHPHLISSHLSLSSQGHSGFKSLNTATNTLNQHTDDHHHHYHHHQPPPPPQRQPPDHTPPAHPSIEPTPLPKHPLQIFDALNPSPLRRSS